MFKERKFQKNKEQKLQETLQELKDGNDRQREAAAKALAIPGEIRAIEPLIHALKDSQWKVRAAAVNALAAIRNPRAVAPIVLLQQDPKISKIIPYALDKFPKTRLVKALLPLSTHAREDVRETALKLLQRHSYPKMTGLLIQALNDSSDTIRQFAQTELQHSKDPRAAGAILASMGALPFKRFQETVTYFLQQGDRRIVPELFKALQRQEKDVRKLAIQTLGDLHDPRAEEPLIEVLGDADGTIRRAAAEALGKLGFPEWQEGITGQSDDFSWLGECGNKHAPTVLLTALRQALPQSEQTLIIKALARQNLSDLIEPLTEMLKHANIMTRFAIIHLLGNFSDPRVLEMLTPYLNDEQVNIRCMIIGTLGRINIPDTGDILLSALHDADRTVRQAAIQALRNSGDSRAVDSLIVRLDDREQRVRQMAVSALAQIGDHRAVPPLIELLADTDLSLRSLTANALAKLGEPQWQEGIRGHATEDLVWLGACEDPRALQPLLRAFKRPTTPDRPAIVKALRNRRDRNAIEPLIALLQSDAAAPVRRDALRILADFDEPRMRELLLSALGDPEVMLRKLALEVLKSSEDPELPDQLLRELELRGREFRRMAVELLGFLSTPRTVEPLLALLGDPDPDIRQIAAKSLGALAEKRAIDPLLGLLDDPVFEVQQAALQALGHIGDARVLDDLLALLDSAKNIMLRHAVITALGELGDSRAVERLVPLIDRKRDLRIRRAVVDALRRIGDIRVAESLRPLLVDSDQWLRKSAAGALAQIGEDCWLACVTGDHNDFARLPESGAPQVFELLKTALQSREILVRSKTLEGLGRLDNPELRPLLLTSLEDADKRVSQTALRMLGAHHHPENLQIFVKAADDPNLQDTALEMIAASCDPRNIVALRSLLSSKSLSTRKKVLTRLANSGRIDAVEPLIGLLQDKELKLDAIQGLGKLGDPQALAALKALLDDPDQKYRRAAALALTQIARHCSSDVVAELRQDLTNRSGEPHNDSHYDRQEPKNVDCPTLEHVDFHTDANFPGKIGAFQFPNWTQSPLSRVKCVHCRQEVQLPEPSVTGRYLCPNCRCVFRLAEEQAAIPRIMLDF